MKISITCCVALPCLFVCLCLLLSFFLLSSLIKTCNTPVLRAILDLFSDIISLQHVFHLGVGRSQIEWKLKVKTQISVFPWAKIGQNDHSNPYIESTTVLSDTYCSSHNVPTSILLCSKIINKMELCTCTIYSVTPRG